MTLEPTPPRASLSGTGLPWRCPTCHRPAAVVSEPGPTRWGDRRGPPKPPIELRCGEAGHVWGSVGGVLCLCDQDNYADSFGKEWLEHARTQVDRHNGTTLSRDKLFSLTRWPTDLHGQRVLEAGSGSGRFTQVLLDAGAETVSFDYSAAVYANRENNGHDPRLTLFRGDIFDIPFAPGSFDRVVCIGVLQHTPDPERACHSLVRMVRPGGELAVDVYRLAYFSFLHPKYYLRPLRKLVPRDTLFSIVRRAVPVLLPVKAALRRIPVVGVPLAFMLVPVPDFRGRLPLTDEQCRQWSELDLVDWISPEHDHPVILRQVERWCRDAGLVEVVIEPVSNGWQFAIRGRKPL